MGGSNSKGHAKAVRTKKTSAQRHSEITSPDRTKLQLKMQRDNLVAAIRRFEIVGNIEHNKAIEFLKEGNRRKALYCLKRERAQNDQINTVGKMLDNIQNLIETIDFMQIESEVVAALRDGKHELEQLNKILNIDDLEMLMNETRESIEEAQQINNVINQPISSVINDEDLIKELEVQMTENREPNILDSIEVPHHKLKQDVGAKVTSEEFSKKAALESV
ncbi:unnamed protein product [Phytomonas sp. Hart1]|nr:unnamed protein product [Phytomonas sp. Hart1]|eukprot:CCW71788.1 unnamed protein product [Phytomonas sp. isolate Hart1]